MNQKQKPRNYDAIAATASDLLLCDAHSPKNSTATQ